MTILSGIKLKLYPNKEQKQTIEQTFGNSRFVWNQFKNMQENRYNAMNQLPPTEVGGLFLSSVVKRLKADSLPKDSVLRPYTFYTLK